MNAIATTGSPKAFNQCSQSGLHTLSSRDLLAVSGGSSTSSGLAGVGFGSAAGLASGAIAGAIWGARVGGFVGAGVGALAGVGFVLATSSGGGGSRLRILNGQR